MALRFSKNTRTTGIIKTVVGPQGDAATIAVGDVTTGAPGSDATVTNVGTSGAAIFDFEIPRGDTGLAATIEVGTVTTVNPGDPAAVTNSGSSSAAVFDFDIPQGDPGDNQSIFVQNSAPATSYLDGSLWIDADSADNDLYQLQSSVWTDTGVNLKGANGVLAGSVGTTDNVVPRANGTGGVTLQAGLFTNDDSGNIYPNTTDTGALGTSTNQWADLFLASGGVINFNNGNYTITHSADALTLNGTLSLGTSNAFTCGSIELGAASDTTLARSAAGKVTIEGNLVAAIADPNADRVLIWDDSASDYVAATLQGPIEISGTTLRVLETFGIALSDETTAITTGTNKATMSLPFAFTVTAVYATLNTVSSSGIPTVDINEAGTTILSTKLTIDANEKTSATAATAAVISDASIAANAEIGFDIDVAGTGAKGLKVFITGYRT